MNSADIDPLWKQIWKTEGIRWLGPQGNGAADAMERFQHGFELGAAHQREFYLLGQWREMARELSESASALWCVLRAGERPPPFVVSVFLEAARKYERMVDGEEVMASACSEAKGDEK